jgi:uncharacterized protein YdeI (YjbR/CyaY-like superfamily)
MKDSELPILEFKNQVELRTWLMDQHSSSEGVWVRVFKKASGIPSVSFEALLDEGLCFGWSESSRHGCDEKSYLQKFTPRRAKGTTSARNQKHIDELIKTGRMTQAGLDVL